MIELEKIEVEESNKELICVIGKDENLMIKNENLLDDSMNIKKSEVEDIDIDECLSNSDS